MSKEDARRRQFIQALISGASEQACRQCLDGLDAYVTAQLAGEDYLARYPEVAVHLDFCAECADAYARLYELELAESTGRLPQPEHIPLPDLSFLQAGQKAVQPGQGEGPAAMGFWERLKNALAPLDPANWSARPVWQPVLALGVVVLVVGLTTYLLLFTDDGSEGLAEATSRPTTAAIAATPVVDQSTGVAVTPEPTELPGTSIAQVEPAETPTGDVNFPAGFPSPTSSLDACQIPTHAEFGSLPQEIIARLGCPLAPAGEIFLIQQAFQNGAMLWREDTRTIYVLHDDGAWEEREDLWTDNTPEYSCGIQETPPSPRRSFGKVWCDDELLRTRLGSAVALESSAISLLQPFAAGWLLISDGQILTLFGDGDWE